jgi:hypothetical protein
MAEEIEQNATPSGHALIVVELWAADLRQAATESAPGAPEPPAAPCGQKDHGRRRTDACDRPAGHQGDHSWEAARQRRLAGDYELAARDVPRLQRQVATLSRRARTAERQVHAAKLEAEAMHRPRRRKPDRG